MHGARTDPRPGGGRRSLVLASRSPARAALLAQIGRPPDCIAPQGIDETVRGGEHPREHAVRIARDKLQAAVRCYPGAWVVAADTVVACGRRILAATDRPEVAERHLRLLSGRAHRVWSAVRVHEPGGSEASRLVCTRVRFRALHVDEVREYLRTGEWRYRAGGYAIQGRGAVFVRGISGSFENVAGLPLTETELLLRGLGMPAARTGA